MGSNKPNSNSNPCEIELKNGTLSAEDLNVKAGGKAYFKVSWDTSYTGTASCTFTFQESEQKWQDPFNGENGGTTTLNDISNGSTVSTDVLSTASQVTDTFSVTLTLGDNSYNVDPQIKVGPPN